MIRKTDRPYKDSLLIIFASVSWLLAFPFGNFNGTPIFAFIVLTILYYGTLNRPLHAVVICYTATGIISTALGAGWLASIHSFALIAAIIYKTLLMSVLGLAVTFLNKIQKKFMRIVYWALLWVLFDAVNHTGVFSFPYLCLPYSFAESLLGLRLAGLGSLYSLSFVSAFISASIVELLLFSRTPGRSGTASVHAPDPGARKKSLVTVPCMTRTLLILCLCIPLFFLIPPPRQPENTPAEPLISIALIQPNYYSFTPVQKDFDTSFAILTNLSQQASALHPDLIVWHETAVVPPVFWYAHQPTENTQRMFSTKVLAFLQNLETPLLTGITWIDFDDLHREKEYNAAILIEHGTIKQVYKKMKLVPFAEYFPFSKELPGFTNWLLRLFGPLRSPGIDPVIFTVQDFHFSAPICFEDSYLSVFSKFGSLPCYIVLTEDSWSKSIALKRQHLAMSQMRAAETGSWVIRASNSGITAVINNNGFVVKALKADTQGILIAEIPHQVPAKHVSWFLYIPLGALVLVLLILIYTFFVNRN